MNSVAMLIPFFQIENPKFIVLCSFIQAQQASHFLGLHINNFEVIHVDDNLYALQVADFSKIAMIQILDFWRSTICSKSIRVLRQKLVFMKKSLKVKFL